MQFNTPYGEADDQSASYLCGLEEGLAIGAITGGVGGSPTGKITFESLMMNGAFCGWAEQLTATTKTFTGDWISPAAGSSFCYASARQIADFLYNAFTNINIDYTIRKLELETIPGKTNRAAGVAINIYDNVEVWMYAAFSSNYTDLDRSTINIENRIIYRALIINNKVMDTMSYEYMRERNTNDSNQCRLMLTLGFYGFKGNKFVWCNSFTTTPFIFVISDNVISFNGYIYNLLDDTQYYNISDIRINSATGTANPTVAIFPYYATKEMKANATKVKVPYITGYTNKNVIELPTVGQFLSDTTLGAIKFTLFSDNEKYFYARNLNGNLIVIDKGTIG